MTKLLNQVNKLLLRITIKKKLYIMLAVQLALLLSWEGYVFIISRNEQKLQIINSNDKINSDNITELIYRLDGMRLVSKLPILSGFTSANQTYTFLNSPSDDELKRFNFYTETAGQFTKYLALHSYLDSIYIYDMDGRGIYGKEGEAYNTYFFKNMNPQSKWFLETMEGKGSAAIFSSFELEDMIKEDNREYLYVTRAIVNPLEYRVIGGTVVRSDVTECLNKFSNQKVFDEQRYGMYLKDGRQLLGDLDPSAFKELDRHISGEFLPRDSVVLQLNGEKMMYSYTYDESNQLLSVIETPYASMMSAINTQQYGFFLMLIVLLALTVFLNSFIISSINKPLKVLVANCKKIENMEFKDTIYTCGKDELSEVMKAFNEMSVKLDSLIEEVYVRKLTEKELELQMLRNQINPHFLYNTLESIRMSAYSRNETDIAQMLMLLGRILRYGVSRPQELATVQDEITHIRHYISLQELRFNNKLDFLIDIEEELLAVKIIKVILQPIVENAIFYGFSDYSSGSIIITGRRNGQTIIFCVQDNGGGMDETETEKLNSYIRGENEEYKGIGLKNVHRRIQLMYGTEYGIKAASKKGEGTVITVTISA